MVKEGRGTIQEPFAVNKHGVYSTTPNSGNSYNVRNVNTDGSLNNNNAYNGNNGVRPDCEKSQTE